MLVLLLYIREQQAYRKLSLPHFYLKALIFMIELFDSSPHKLMSKELFLNLLTFINTKYVFGSQCSEIPHSIFPKHNVKLLRCLVCLAGTDALISLALTEKRDYQTLTLNASRLLRAPVSDSTCRQQYVLCQPVLRSSCTRRSNKAQVYGSCAKFKCCLVSSWKGG